MFPLSKQLALAGITGFALVSLCSPVWSADGSVRNIRYDQNTRHFLIDATGPVKATVNTLNIAGHKRIIMDLDNAEIGIDLPRDVQLLQDLSQQLPSLKNLTVNQYGGNGRPIVRILIDLQGDPGSVRLVRNQGPHIEMEVNESAAYVPRPSGSTRSLDMPPSLSGLKQPANADLSSQRPLINPTGDNLSNARPNSVSQETYNRSLQAQQEQLRQLEALKQDLARTKSQKSDDIAIDDLKRTLAILNQKYEGLLQENHYLKSQIDMGNQSQSSVNDEQARLNGEIERLKSANASLQNRVSSLLSSQTKTSSTELTAKQAEVTRLQSENRTLQNRLEQQTTSESALADLKRQLDELTRRNDKLSQENSGLQSQLSTKTQSASTLTAQQTEIARLKADKASLETRINLLSNKPSATPAISDTDLQALRKQLTLAQQSLNGSIATINEQNKEIAFLRNQVNDVKAGMDASAREQISQLQTQQDEKDATIRDLQRQLATSSKSTVSVPASQTEVASLKRQLEKYQADAQTLNQQLKARNAELARAQSGASQSATADLQQRTEQIAALQNELASLQSVKKERDAAKQEVVSLKGELTQLQSNHSSGNQSSTTLKEAMAKLTQENQDLHKMLDSLRHAPATNDQSRQLQTQLAAKQKDFSELQTRYEKATQDANKAKQDLLFLQKSQGQNQSADKTTKNNPVLSQQVEDLNRKLAETRRENETLRSKLSPASTAPSTAANPEAEQAYLAGKTAMESKETGKAIDQFKEAQLLEPDTSKYAIDYSIALAEDHQYAEAIDVLRRYLQRNPIDRDAYNQLGKIYLLNDQADAANQAFSRAISVSTLNNYATSLKKLRKNDDAEAVFKLALSLNPKDSEVLFNLGNLYNSQNKLELARNRYLEAIQLKPDFAEAHYNLGLIYSKLGDNPKAAVHLEKFIQLSPNARNVETIRAYVQKLKA